MRILILILILVQGTLAAQPPPAPRPPDKFGTTQNNISGTQARSFGGGSIIKPNPMWTSADFAFIQNPTYETGWRYGTGLGYSKTINKKGWGGNAVITFDFTQQSYSLYRRNNNWYYHYNLGKMGTTVNTGLSTTRVFPSNKINTGIQSGISILEDHKEVYFIVVPYVVFLANKEITLSEKIQWTPEAFITVCSPYYDLGAKFSGTSNTFNAVVGNNLTIKVSKYFRFNLNWRMNMNTTPKWGVMNNILVGTNLKF